MTEFCLAALSWATFPTTCWSNNVGSSDGTYRLWMVVKNRMSLSVWEIQLYMYVYIYIPSTNTVYMQCILMTVYGVGPIYNNIRAIDHAPR